MADFRVVMTTRRPLGHMLCVSLNGAICRMMRAERKRGSRDEGIRGKRERFQDSLVMCRGGKRQKIETERQTEPIWQISGLTRTISFLEFTNLNLNLSRFFSLWCSLKNVVFISKSSGIPCYTRDFWSHQSATTILDRQLKFTWLWRSKEMEKNTYLNRTKSK